MRKMTVLRILADKNLTAVLFIILILMSLLEGESGLVSGWAFMSFAFLLFLNLFCCLLNHLIAKERLTAQNIGFLTFHAALLVIMAGGITTYYTYRMGYVRVVEGTGFIDNRENYTEWTSRNKAGKGTGIRITVNKISIDFWENGQIRKYTNDLSISDKKGDRKAVIGVNNSVRHGDLLINLARFYGLAPQFTLMRPSGDISGFAYMENTKKTNEFRIPLLGYKTKVFYGDFSDRQIYINIEMPDGSSIERIMMPGDIIDLGTERLRLNNIHVWNGLTIVTDKGKGISFTGFVLFLAGLLMYYVNKFVR